MLIFDNCFKVIALLKQTKHSLRHKIHIKNTITKTNIENSIIKIKNKTEIKINNDKLKI